MKLLEVIILRHLLSIQEINCFKFEALPFKEDFSAMSWLDLLYHPDTLFILVVHEVCLGHKEEFFRGPLFMFVPFKTEAKHVVISFLVKYFMFFRRFLCHCYNINIQR